MAEKGQTTGTILNGSLFVHACVSTANTTLEKEDFFRKASKQTFGPQILVRIQFCCSFVNDFLSHILAPTAFNVTNSRTKQTVEKAETKFKEA